MPRTFRYPRRLAAHLAGARSARTADRGFGAVASIALIAPGPGPSTRRRGADGASSAARSIGKTAGARAGYRRSRGAVRSRSGRATPAAHAPRAARRRRCACCCSPAPTSPRSSWPSAVGRARTYAIQLAIGASRASLAAHGARSRGSCLVGAAAAVAAWPSRGGRRARRLHPAGHRQRQRQSDRRRRARRGCSWLAVAAATWLLSHAAGRRLRVAREPARPAQASKDRRRRRRGAARASAARSTVVQIALAVLLLVGSVLYVRTYLALMRLDKGFDSSGVVSINLTIPPQAFGTAAERAVVRRRILERVRARPGVIAAFEGAPPPSTGDSPMHDSSRSKWTIVRRWNSNLAVPEAARRSGLLRGVEHSARSAGRMFEPGEPPTNVIISAGAGVAPVAEHGSDRSALP